MSRIIVDRHDKHDWRFKDPADEEEWMRRNRLHALSEYRKMKADARWHIERAAASRAVVGHYGTPAVIAAVDHLTRAQRITRHAQYLAMCRQFTAEEIGAQA